MKLLKKILQPYNVLFFLAILTIIVTIIANYNTHSTLEPDYIKNLPWNKRSSYVKQKELLAKLKNKKYYTDNELPIINELITISDFLNDTKTLRYAQKIKYNYLFSSFKEFSNVNYINIIDKDMSLEEKLASYLLSNNEEFLKTIIKNSSKKDKLKILYMLKLFYPEKIKKYEDFFDKEDIDNINLIVEYINIKGE